jgi:hypothetical protein
MEYFETRCAAGMMTTVLKELATRLMRVKDKLPKHPETRLLNLIKGQLATNVYQTAEASLRDLEAALTSANDGLKSNFKEDLSLLYLNDLTFSQFSITMPLNNQRTKIELNSNSFMADSRHSDDPYEDQDERIELGKVKKDNVILIKSNRSQEKAGKRPLVTDIKKFELHSVGYYGPFVNGVQKANNDMKSVSSNNSIQNSYKNPDKSMRSEKPKGMVASLLSRILTPQSRHQTDPLSDPKRDKSNSISKREDHSTGGTPLAHALRLNEATSQQKGPNMKRESMKSGVSIADPPNPFLNLVAYNDFTKHKLGLLGNLKAQKQWSSLFSPHKANYSTSRKDSPMQSQDKKRRTNLQDLTVGSLVSQKGMKSMIMQKGSTVFNETLTPGVSSRVRQRLQSPLKSASMVNSAIETEKKASIVIQNNRELRRPATTDRMLEGCSMTYGENSKKESISIKKTLEALKKSKRKTPGQPSIQFECLKNTNYSNRFSVLS